MKSEKSDDMRVSFFTSQATKCANSAPKGTLFVRVVDCNPIVKKRHSRFLTGAPRGRTAHTMGMEEG
jgi:hypothetical protein